MSLGVLFFGNLHGSEINSAKISVEAFVHCECALTVPDEKLYR